MNAYCKKLPIGDVQNIKQEKDETLRDSQKLEQNIGYKCRIICNLSINQGSSI